MRRRSVPGTQLELTEIGFGGAAIGNPYRAVDTATAHAAIEAAWHAGIRVFDTAPHYGLGLSERRLGAALGVRDRDAYVLSSKVGRLLATTPHPTGLDYQGFDVADTWMRRFDYSEAGTRRSIEDSLDRLGLDRLDIVYVHDPDEHWEQASSEAMPALARMRDEGLVGAIGAGMKRSPMLARFLRETDADLVMVAGRYTLLEQDALDDVLAAADETGKSVVAAGVFNSGLLAGPLRGRELTYDYAPAPAPVVERARAISDACDRHGVALPAVAIALPLAHPRVACVTLGMRDADEVVTNVELSHTPVPSQLWEDLRAAGLLRADAPTP
jgi:D-threo-aldose 1-dehydrogenase